MNTDIIVNADRWTNYFLQRPMIKIIHNVVAVDFSSYLHRSVSRTRGHHLRFTTIPARINVLYHSFLPSAITLWNSLPEETVQSSN